MCLWRFRGAGDVIDGLWGFRRAGDLLRGAGGVTIDGLGLWHGLWWWTSRLRRNIFINDDEGHDVCNNLWMWLERIWLRTNSMYILLYILYMLCTK